MRMWLGKSTQSSFIRKINGKNRKIGRWRILTRNRTDLLLRYEYRYCTFYSYSTSPLTELCSMAKRV